MDRIIAFDVETPNSYNDRMSSIGIAVIQNGQIFRTWSTLVNPETHFDRLQYFPDGYFSRYGAYRAHLSPAVGQDRAFHAKRPAAGP